MKRIVKMAILAAVGVAAGLVVAAPKPSDVPVTWELDIMLPAAVRPIQATLPGEKGPTTFWYLRYLVTNDSHEDRVFIPVIDLSTNTGQVLHAGHDVPKGVFDAVKKLHNQPLLKDIAGMTGKILQGEDNAKAGVAIWPDIDPEAGIVDVFVGGLSGETKTVKLPKPIEVTTIDEKGQPKTIRTDEITLRKTLQLTYRLPGEAGARLTTPAKLIRKQWIMR